MKPYFRFYFFRFEISIQKMWGRNQLLENYEKSIFDEINSQKKKNFKVFKLKLVKLRTFSPNLIHWSLIFVANSWNLKFQFNKNVKKKSIIRKSWKKTFWKSRVFEKKKSLPSGHAVLWRHRFFVGFTWRYRPITYWDWSDIVIRYLFPKTQWCCSDNRSAM